VPSYAAERSPDNTLAHMQSGEKREQPSESTLQFRLGAAALGLFGGGAFGLVVALLVSVSGAAESYFPLFVFGGAALGAVVGYFHNAAGFAAAEAAATLGMGFIVGFAERAIDPLPESPRWLKVVYWLGLSLGLLALILAYW
jgi:hypothetical protein